MKKVKTFYLFILVSIASWILAVVVFQIKFTSLSRPAKQRLKKLNSTSAEVVNSYEDYEVNNKLKERQPALKTKQKSQRTSAQIVYRHDHDVNQGKEKQRPLERTSKLHNTSAEAAQIKETKRRLNPTQKRQGRTSSEAMHSYEAKQRKEKKRQPKPTRKRPRTSTEIVDTYDIRRTGTHCEFRYDWGEMCPKLYTELGGRCDLIESKFECRDIRNSTKYKYRQAQLVITRMLRIFHLLAQKHNITFWIAHGTLLGAVRHRGFIPWDYDVDIHVPLDDYVKFFQVAAKELPSDIFFQNSVSDPAIIPDDPDIAESLDYHKIVGIYERTWNPRLRDRNSCNGFCFEYDCKWHDGLMMDIFVFPSVDPSVYPLKRMPFEGFLFPVPSSWKEDLISEYGDDIFEIPTDESPETSLNLDTFNGCEKFTKQTS